MQVYDANGNPVTENSTFCTRCGAHIKYVFEYEGKPYGSTCIEAVSGIRPDNWVWVDGKANEQATRQSLAEKEQATQERIEAQQVLEAQRESVRQANQAQYADLIEVLNGASRYHGDFCSSMVETLVNASFSTELYEGILSPRQYQIVREIWGKQTGGRINSKAYKAAVAEFDRKFDNE